MASRFFHGGSSDSDTDTSSDDSYTSSEDEILPTPAPKSATSSAFSKYLKDEDSSDEDSGKRVVKSGKDKLIAELRAILVQIDAGKKENNWILIHAEFDKLTKQVAKGQNVIRQSGHPSFYLKALVDLEAFLLKQHDDKKKLNAQNAKALIAMKQKLRKVNAGLKSEIDMLGAVNTAQDAVAEVSESYEEPPKPKSNAPAKNRFSRDVSSDSDAETEESDEDDMGSESESESESDDDRKGLTGRDRWKKTVPSSTKAEAFKKVDAKAPKKVVDFATDKPTTKNDDKAMEFSPETLYARLSEVREARGKKGTDKAEQISILERLLGVAVKPIQKARVLMSLISARFDSSQSIEMWKSTEREIIQLFLIIECNSNIVMQESVDEFTEEDDTAEIQCVRGNVVSLVSRLDDEFQKSLQNIDPHTTEYIARLKDEATLYGLIIRGEEYCLKKKELESVALLRILRLEHIYFKYNDVILKIEEAARQNIPKVSAMPEDADVLVHDICVYLYKYAPDRVRARAVLCHVYHHALNNRYFEARDLLLMSHLQDSIQKTDISTQVLYNRCLAQIGICAFRSGLIKESHYALTEIMAAIKTKDIMSQGTQLQRYQSVEQDRKEKQRMIPFHMHINLELLEAIQLTVSMLLEIPAMAANTYDRKKVISKHFRRLFEFFERQVFIGPPESFKDSVMHAAKNLSEGNWQQCAALICSMKQWDLLPDSQPLREMIVSKIKEEALRTYVFRNARYYEHLGIKQLADMFQLEHELVYGIVGRLILEEELFASIDEPAMMISFHRVDFSRLQFMASQFAEKASLLVEGNEKLFESLFQQQQPVKPTDNFRGKHYHSNKAQLGSLTVSRK